MGRAASIAHVIWEQMGDIREQIHNAKREGLSVPNYIVGFHNGLAFARHQLLGTKGTPQGLLDAENEIVTKTNPEPLAEDEQEYEFLVDKLVTAARDQAATGSLQIVAEALSAIDSFVAAKLEQGGEAEQSQHQGSGQVTEVEGANPSPAPNA